MARVSEKRWISKGRRLVLIAAALHMLEFGDRQAGAYYPTSDERAGNIARAGELRWAR